jgi:D-3-phosphoglycerate dehydrogenase / 2-oxoglutarate reductase
MPYCVAIGPSSFAEVDRSPLDMLSKAGIEVRHNPFNRRLNEDETIELLRDADGLIAGLEPLNQKVLISSHKLKAIARVGIGTENIDLETSEKLAIKVSNTPDGPTEAVAEMCLTALLAMIRRLIPFNMDMHRGKWNKTIGLGVAGTNILLVGYGRIGRRFAELLRPLGARILVCDPNTSQDEIRNGEILLPLDEGLKEAEVISLHASGKNIILNRSAFHKMRKGAVLLNSARGELLDESALIEALEKNIVSSAWMDSFSNEPYSGPLMKYEQVVLTPHISTYSIQCRKNMETDAVKNLFRDLGIELLTE